MRDDAYEGCKLSLSNHKRSAAVSLTRIDTTLFAARAEHRWKEGVAIGSLALFIAHIGYGGLTQLL